MEDGFTMIPNALIEHSDFTLHELVVYIVLKKYRNERTKKCWPGMATISDEARVSRRTALRTIESLEERGVIRVEREKNKNNVYTVADVTPPKDLLSSAKGTRRPKRSTPSDSQSLVRAATFSPSDSQSLPSDSQSLPSDSESPDLVTPSHSNKTKRTRSITKTNHQDVRSDSRREIDVSFEVSEEPRATAKQLLYIHDLYIHLTGYIPTAELKQRWTEFTLDEAADRIDTMLKQIPRYDAYEGPEVGTPAYDALSTIGRDWADRGMIPDILTGTAA